MRYNVSAIVLFLFAFAMAAGEARAQEFGRFSGNPLVELDPDGRSIIVKRDFSFTDLENRQWLVKADYKADGASIPKAFWSYIGGPLEGAYRDASIIHDYFCERRAHSSDEVHKTFYLGMRARNVDPSKAWIMYKAVSWFGPRWQTVQEIPDSCQPGHSFSPEDCVINSVPKVVNIEQPLDKGRFEAFLTDVREEGYAEEAALLEREIQPLVP